MRRVLTTSAIGLAALALAAGPAAAQTVGRPGDAEKLKALNEQTQKLLGDALQQQSLTPEQLKQLEQMRRLRALQSRGGRGPQSGAPIILNGGAPLGPSAAPATGESPKSKAKKSASDKRAQARRYVEERRRKAQAEAERKKAARKAAAEAPKLEGDRAAAEAADKDQAK